MAEKENFYQELDSKTKRSPCTCQTLALAFLVLIVGLVILVVIGVKKITTAVAPARQVVGAEQDSVNLQQKVSELAKNPGASTSLAVTEQELTRLLIEGISLSPTIPLRNIQAEINPSGIVLSGTATKFLNSTLLISILPKVVDGQAKLELVKIQAGSLPVPTALTELLSRELENAMSKELSQLKDITIKSILLGKGMMTITGVLKALPSPNPSISV